MKQTNEEIEAQIIAWLKLRTGIQRKVRASTSALEAVEKKLSELLQQLAEHSQP